MTPIGGLNVMKKSKISGRSRELDVEFPALNPVAITTEVSWFLNLGIAIA
jgi:hypothetical protein